jgi:serine/threonine-protein kinase
MQDAPVLPDLDDLERLGEGGMGTVFRARQRSLDRVVAVKLLREDLQGDEDLRRRFEREAKALARIEHPNVVQVHATGEHRGRPYYIMKYVDGVPVDRWLAGRPARAVAEVFRRVAAAVDAAHAAGVLHRDLTPGNVLVDARGEPVVVDFGLAKRLERAGGEPDESLSVREPVLGTPAYVAPEVAAGDPHVAASDVYGLGATLYKVLAGRAPFEGEEGLLTKLRRIREEDPTLPRRLRPEVEEPLQAICLKAMERAPADRYASAGEMARDLERFLAGEPVLARPSLYRSLLERRVRDHVAAVDDWAREGLLSRRERDRLAEGYERLVEGERDSIFEAERLSLGLVLLYVGALVVALGPAVLASVAFGVSPLEGRGGTLLYRLGATLGPLLALAAAGGALWRRAEYRTALPFLLGAALLVPPLAWVLLHEVPSLREAAHEGESREATLDRWDPAAAPREGLAGALQRTLDRKLLLAAAATLAAGLLLRRRTRSPAFIWFSVAAGLWLTHAALVDAAGWRALPDHERAAAFFPASLALLAAGLLLDRRARPRDARPFYVLGFATLILAWAAFAAEGYPAEYAGPWERGEAEPLSFAAGGLLALALAALAERAGTPLLHRYALGPYLASVAGTLPSLSVLVADRLLLYEVLLPLACLAFVGLSVLVQRKNLLYGGGVYLSVAVFQVTRNHFRDEWAWPLVISASGACLMAGAWALPRLAARIR